MPVTFQLPADLEQRLRAEIPNLEGEAREAYVLDLFRRGKLTHFELTKVLGVDRFETDAILKRHNVYEGSLTLSDLEADRKTLEKVLGSSHR
jgi:predicted HTH domain antitoxin